MESDDEQYPSRPPLRRSRGGPSKTATASPADPTVLWNEAFRIAVMYSAGNRDLAKDVASEVRDSILAKLEAQDGDVRDLNNLPGLIQTSVHNAFLDIWDAEEVRRNARKRIIAKMTHRASSVASAAATVETEELRAAINGAINKLPPRQRQVWCFRYLNELDFKQIAEILRISVYTVKEHRDAANKTLQKLLKHHRPESMRGITS